MNLVCFIWLPFPKSFTANISERTIIPDTVTNLLIFFAFSLFVISSFVSITDFEISAKRRFGYCALIMASKLLLDLIYMLLLIVVPSMTYTVSNVFTVLSVFVAFLLAIKCMMVKFDHLGKFILFAVVAAVVLIAANLYFDIRDTQNLNYTLQKYLTTDADNIFHNPAEMIGLNIKYSFSVRNAVLDTVYTSVLLILSHFFFNSFKAKKISWRERVSTILEYICIIGIISIFLCVVKAALIPWNALGAIGSGSSGAYSKKYYDDLRFLFEDKGVQRKEEFADGKYYYVYHNTCGKLYYKDSLIGTADRCFPYMFDSIDDYSIGNIDVAVVGYDCFIVIMEGDNPEVIKFEDIKDEEYNEVLVGIGERLFEEGRIYSLEYFGEYLNKYDKEFLKPYIERCANSDFTNEELEFLNHNYINPEFITQIANQLT